MEAILRSPLFSPPEEFNDAKTGLKVTKENFPNKIIVKHLSIKSLRINLKLYNLRSIEI